MPCRKTSFKKVSRIIVPLIGIADGIFLVFVYSSRYWLTFIGYRQFIISLLLLIFSIADLSLAFSVFVIAKHLIHYFNNIYNLISSIIFFLIFTLLYFSSIKSFDETQYWIQTYNATFSSTKIVDEFYSKYPGDDSQAFIRQRTFIVHDVLLLTILIWTIAYIIFTFLSSSFLKFITSATIFEEHEPEFISEHSNNYDYYENDEYETEIDNVEGTRDNSKVKHVRSAAKLFNLVNIQDTDGSLHQQGMSNVRNDENISKTDNTNTNKPNDEITSSPPSARHSHKQDSPKSTHRKKARVRKKSSSALPQPDFDSIDQNKTNDDVSISSSTPLNISPLVMHILDTANPQSTQDNETTQSNLDLESRSRPIIRSQASQTIGNPARARKPFMDPMPIRFHISSSSSSSYSSSSIFDSDDPLGLFADDTSDSWH